MDIDNLHLYVDTKDNYGEDESCFVINPKRLYSVWCCRNSIFKDCEIKNTDCKYLSRLNLIQIREKLIPLAKLTVYISEPVEVLNEVSADAVEANIKAAGFEDIERNEDASFECDGQEISAISISAVKPKKNIDDIDITAITEETTKIIGCE